MAAIRSYQESLASAANEREFDEEMRHASPAIKALGGLRLPTGLRNCTGGSAPVEPYGHVCWRGTARPVATTAQIVAEVKQLGATDVIAKCLQLRTFGELCLIRATLKGQPLELSFGSDTTRTSEAHPPPGVFVAGGVGPASQIAGVMPRHGTPIPIPSVTSTSIGFGLQGVADWL